jgi:Sulfotransferase family
MGRQAGGCVKPDDRLPDFLIIGAIKAATTWLAWQLQQSEAIFLPKPEPHYFTREHQRGLEWYRTFFAEAAPGQIIGEKTADYLANPDAAERIAELLPKARLLVQLRDPVDRAYSDYCMLFRRGCVTGQIEDYLDPRRAHFRRFLDNGLYHAHLSRWLKSFPREQLAILLFEDVVAHPNATLREVAGHIGVAVELVPKPMTDRVNDSRAALLPLPLRKLLAPAKDLAAPLRGTRWFEAIRATVARPVAYPPLTDDLRRRLGDFYAPDIGALEKLTGRDLSGWMPASRAAA